MRNEELDRIYKEASETSGNGFKGAYESITVYGEVYSDANNNSRKPGLRWEMLKRKDVHNKTILDIGCNIGGMCIESMLMGANKCFGIELSDTILAYARRISKTLGLENNVTYIQGNVEDFDLFSIGHVDTVFLFSVWGHIGNKTNIKNYLKNGSFSVLYFEGHPRIPKGEYIEYLSELGLSCEFLGYADNNMGDKDERSFFRCHK